MDACFTFLSGMLSATIHVLGWFTTAFGDALPFLLVCLTIGVIYTEGERRFEAWRDDLVRSHIEKRSDVDFMWSTIDSGRRSKTEVEAMKRTQTTLAEYIPEGWTVMIDYRGEGKRFWLVKSD